MLIRTILQSARKLVSLAQFSRSQTVRSLHTIASRTQSSFVKSITISPGKKEYYLDLLKPWVPGATIYRKDLYAVQSALIRCTYAIPTGRLYMRLLRELFESFTEQAVRHPSTKQPSVQLSDAMLTDIQWWRERLSSPLPSTPGSESITASSFFTDNSQPRIFVDASNWGIGLIVNDRWFAWRFVSGWATDGRDSLWAEMIAILLAKLYIASNLPAISAARLGHILVHSDSLLAIDIFKAGRSSSTQLCAVVERTAKLSDPNGIQLRLEHISGKENPADVPSRGYIRDLPKLTDMPALPDFLEGYLIPM